MASILDLKSDSSDSEDDCDYVPPPNVANSDESEDEISEEESEFLGEPATKKTKLDTKKDENQHLTSVGKKSDDEIWKSFLKEVDTKPLGKINGKQCPVVSSDLVSEPQNNTENGKPSDKLSTNKKEETVIQHTVTANLILAEEDKNLKKEMNQLTDEKAAPTIPPVTNKTENRNDTKQQEPTSVQMCPARTGISAILGTIANKGKKPTVLEKSLQDWKTYKEEEGIEKDLEIFNKGRQGFIERQRFLQRSDLRTFETEKSVRLTGGRKK